MSDSHRAASTPTSQPHRLPPFKSFGEDVHFYYRAAHRRRTSTEDSNSDEVIENLRQELYVRDQTIISLKAEQVRIQSICNKLDTKSQIMDYELANIVEEKSELKQQATELSVQVESLLRDKQQLQRQSQADAAQWQQIMSMSSKLQLQSVEEIRKLNAERDTWTRSKELSNPKTVSCDESVALLNSDPTLGAGTETFTPTLQAAIKSGLTSGAQIVLENDMLRRRNSKLEIALSDILKEASMVERAGSSIKQISECLIMNDGSTERAVKGTRHDPGDST